MDDNRMGRRGRDPLQTFREIEEENGGVDPVTARTYSDEERFYSRDRDRIYKIPDVDVTQADCGVFCTYFVLVNENVVQPMFPDIRYMRESLDKKPQHVTFPANILELLLNKGFDVTYFSTLPWSMIAEMGDEELTQLIRDIGYFPGGQMSVSKLKGCAELITTKGLPYMGDYGYEDSDRGAIEHWQRLLAEGNFLMVVVRMDHYIVLLEDNNDGTVRVFDPTPGRSPLLDLTWEEVSMLWRKTIGPFKFREMLAIKKRDDSDRNLLPAHVITPDDN